ncbi:MAG: preprotein translocase subunit SecG [Pseudomonadota bacterium]
MDQILLVVQGLIALALVGSILMQRSEGGALGIGGGPGGMMSARGAGNFLTRATTILAVLFLGMCILLAVRSGIGRGDSQMEGFNADADPIGMEDTSGIPALPSDTDTMPLMQNLQTTDSPSTDIPGVSEAFDPNAEGAPAIPSDGQQ